MPVPYESTPNILVANFRGVLPGGPGDQYTLQAQLDGGVPSTKVVTNKITLPAFGKFVVGTPNVPGPYPDYEVFGAYLPRVADFPVSWMNRPLDKSALGVVFRAQVLQGSLSPQYIEQAAYNDLILEITDTRTIKERRRRAPFMRRMAAGRRLASDRGPVQTRSDRTRELKLPSWSNYVSPKKPGER